MQKKITLSESQLHKQICDYLKLQYPKVLFNTDLSGVKLSIGQAKKAKQLRSGRGFPDIVIYDTSLVQSKTGDVDVFSALFLEVKKETPFKKDGNLKKNAHLEEQSKILERLNNKGYKALFVWTFDYAKSVIDDYLNN